MSEFSPDTIQFAATAETPSTAPESAPQSAIYQKLSQWLAQSEHPVWQQWLQQQAQEAALTSFSKALVPPFRLSTLPHQLRALHEQIYAATPYAKTLRQLLYNWQKQTEALTLNNRSAYEKTSEERQRLSGLLAEAEWPATFIQHCHQVEQFLTQQAETRFKLVAPVQTLIAPTPPQESTPLTHTDSGFVLPSHLKPRIFQRSPQAWLRRAARYLQMAWQDNFSDKNTLKQLLKSLYAALEQDPQNGQALLLLGWIFACMGNTSAAMACLERLREHKSPSEMIFLIRFLQNRPVL